MRTSEEQNDTPPSILRMRTREAGELEHPHRATQLLSGEQSLEHESRDCRHSQGRSLGRQGWGQVKPKDRVRDQGSKAKAQQGQPARPREASTKVRPWDRGRSKDDLAGGSGG